jgi:serine/threonine protein kinase
MGVQRQMKTRKQTKQIKQRGGKYVGQGTYGCGFYPALRCAGSVEREPGMFSKLMEEDTARDEFQQNKLLRLVDPEQKYLLYPLKFCRVNRLFLNKGDPNNNTSRCEGIFENIKNEGFLLFFKNGGPDLSKKNIAAGEYAAFFRDLLQLFEGLALLHQNNVVHLDIKEPNIVYETISAEPPAFHFRYIDFGLSRDVKIPLQENDSVMLATYFAYPYELRFAYPYFSKGQITRQSIDDYMRTNFNFKLDFFIPEQLMWVRTERGRKTWSHEKFVSLWDGVESGEADEESLQKSADVFALGRTLATIYGTLLGHTMTYDGICVPNKSVEHYRELIFTKKVPLERMDESPKKRWHTRVANEISTPLYNLVYHMMRFDYLNRLTIDKALESYKSLIPKFQELFTQDNIEKYLSPLFPRLAPLDPLSPTPIPSLPFNVASANNVPRNSNTKKLKRQLASRKLISNMKAPTI